MAKSKHKISLLNAHKEKDDEYYTLFEDISAEVPLYKEQLRGKRILCPCDWDESYNEEVVFKAENHIIQTTLFSEDGTIKNLDIQQTKKKIEKDLNLVKCNFVKFLVSHADDYEIKSISVSGYNPYTKQGIKFQDINYKHYDLVITNPPFSQFRELIDVLFKNQMEFLVIGPQNAISYKECFNYIKDNQMWLGYAKQLQGFGRPDGTKILSKNPEGSVPRACKWFTNLDVTYRHDRIILTEEYNPAIHPNYYNYKGIDVSKTKEIPFNYCGEMGVPITFLQKYNPEQFEIIGKGVQAEKTIRFAGDKATLWIEKDGKPFKAPFERIIIKNKNPQV